MTPVESAGAMRGGGAGMVVGEHESLDRLVNAVVTVVPLISINFAVPFLRMPWLPHWR